MKKKLSFKDWADLNGYRTDGAYFAARAKQYEAYLYEELGRDDEDEDRLYCESSVPPGKR